MRPHTTVKDVMSKVLITATEDQSIDEADYDMRVAAIRHIPVVNASGKLVGIASNRDIARAFSKIGRSSVRISSVMSESVITAGEDTSIVEAIERMLEHKIGCLPVVGDGGELRGIVTETDCLRVALSCLRQTRGSEPTSYRA